MLFCAQILLFFLSSCTLLPFTKYVSHKQFIKTITDKDNKISYFLLYLISEPYGPAVPMSKVIFDPRNPTCSPYVLWDRIQS